VAGAMKRRRCAPAAAAMCVAAALLAGCAVPDSQSGKEAVALRPLSVQPPTPGGAPRSRVPQVNYDLSTPGTGYEDWQDGVPGQPGEVFQRGGASWYGVQFHDRKTANGERFDMNDMTAAHRTLAFNTRVCVRSLVNGREVLVRINDRGPFAAGRVIDLSRAAAEKLDMVGLGIKQVALTVVDQDGMRCDGKAVGPASTTDVAEMDEDIAAPTQSRPDRSAKPKSGSAAGKHKR